jgi:hypothetical protein
MPEIISSFPAFEEKFKDSAFLQAKADLRLKALNRYFTKGGVARFGNESKGAFPKLSYPSKSRVQQLMDETKTLKELLEGKRKDWIKAHNDAKVYHLKLHAKKLANPLFWKHVGKKIADKDYRIDSDTVKLPSELVADKKYKAMVEMFVNNLDYRKQLTETVKNSIVYKNSQNRLARYLDDLQDFRKGVSKTQIEDLNKKIIGLHADLEMLEIMKKWAED